MKNEKGSSAFHGRKENGLYDTPFSATVWEVEIHEVGTHFKWVAKYYNVSMEADHPINKETKFKTADEAYDDFTKVMKSQCICICSKKIIRSSHE